MYNFLISTCGKCKNANEAIRVCQLLLVSYKKFPSTSLFAKFISQNFGFFSFGKVYEEMKTYGVERNTQTYVCLLNACAAAGHLVCVRVSSFCCTQGMLSDIFFFLSIDS